MDNQSHSQWERRNGFEWNAVMATKKRKIVLWIASLLLAVCCFLILLIAFLPAIISTEWGRTQLLKLVNSRISGSIEARSLNLSWFGEQSLEELAVYDEHKNPVIECEKATSTASLWSLMKTTPHIGRTVFTHPRVYLIIDESGRTNVEKAFGVAQSHRPLHTPAAQQMLFFPVSAIPSRTIWKHFISSEQLFKPFYGYLEALNGDCIIEASGLEKTTFSKLGLSLRIHETEKLPSFHLHCLVAQGTHTGQIMAETNAAEEEIGNAGGTGTSVVPFVDWKASFKNIPLNGFDQLLGLWHPQFKGALTAGLGTELNLSMSGQLTRSELSIKGDLNTPQLSAQFSAKTENEALSLAAPVPISFSLTENAWNYFTRHISFLPIKLNTPISMTVNLRSLSIPMLSDSLKFADLSQTSYQADVYIPELLFYTLPENKPIFLSNVKGTYEKTKTNNVIPFSIFSEASFAEKRLPEHAQIDFEGTLPKAGSLLNEFHPSLKLQARNLPIDSLSLAFIPRSNDREKLLALLGHQANLSFEFDFDPKNSPFNANIFSSHSHILIVGKVNEKNITLTAPLAAELKVTPELSRLLLKDVNPLLVSAIGSERPIKLLIQHQGVSIPIHPFDLNKLTVPHANLDLGKIFFKNGGPLNAIVDLLKLKNLAALPEIVVWFTPLHFHIADGSVTVDRMDGLIEDHFLIATWGRINLADDEVRMHLGIPGESLQAAFGLSKLPDDYMLQLSLLGSTSDLSIDWAQASKEITKLIIQDTGTKPGKFLGSLLNLLDNLSEEKASPPPPAPRPYPWE